MVPCIFRSGRRVPLIYLSLSLGSLSSGWVHVLCAGLDDTVADRYAAFGIVSIWFPNSCGCIFSFGGHALQLSGSLALWPSSTRQGLSLPVEKTNWMALLFETAFFSDMWRASSSFSSSSVYSIPLILLVLCVLAWFQVQIILSILLFSALCVTFSSPPRLVEDEWAGQQEGEEEEEKEEERRRKNGFGQRTGKDWKYLLI